MTVVLTWHVDLVSCLFRVWRSGACGSVLLSKSEAGNE